MRLGMLLPAGPGGVPLGPAGIAEGARRLERTGFDSAWVFDSIGRGFILPDPLIALSVAATVTSRIQLGTCVLQVPLRRPVELAHRVLTAHLVADGRLVLGVGVGSTEDDFAAVGVDYDRRFRAFADALPVMRSLWRGETVGRARLTPWPAALGGPPVLIGSWAGSRWIERAATTYDGWIGSAAKTSLRDLTHGIQRFRALGGSRAVVANVEVDLTAPAAGPAVEDAPFTLRCPPDEAAERLNRLAELGFDDAVLFGLDHREETLATIRGLIPAG